jgi:hypothetical protein
MSDMEKNFNDATMQDKSEVQAPNTLAQTPSLDIEGKVDDLDGKRLRAQGHEAQLERAAVIMPLGQSSPSSKTAPAGIRVQPGFCP